MANILQNVIIGKFAGRHVNSGSNVIIGAECAEIANAGANVMIGAGVGDYNSGGYNVLLGCGAGSGEYSKNISGSYNVFIGYNAGKYETNSNRLYIANSGTSTPLIWGNFSTGVVKVNGSTVTTSDERFKDNIKSLEGSLQKVLNMRGVSYTWKTKAEMAEIRGVTPDSTDYSTRIQEGTQLGVIAQEIEKVVPEVVYTDEEGFKSVDYVKLTPVLIEAIKEQQSIIDTQDKKIDAQQKEIDELKAQLEAILEKLK